MKNVLLAVIVAAARIGGVALLGAAALLAQTKPADPATEPKKEKPEQLDRFVVTGSYIPSTETAVEAGSSPVTRIDRQAIEEGGYTKTAELLQQITTANANSIPISNNATGFTPAASAPSLRGLGPEATLVLINGRRVAPYPVGAGGTTAFVDLNSIPLSAIDSIEVLRDGASAVYGADAVAGVINIKLRRSMDGSEAFISYGNTTHKDSSEIVANVATGAISDKANILVAVNYYRRAGIMHRDRAYSAVPPFLSTNASPMNLDLGRVAIAAALNQPVNAAIPGVPANAIFIYGQSGADANNRGTKPASQYTYTLDRSSTYNFNEFAMTYPESTRKGAVAFGERKLFGADNIRGYVDASYQNVRMENQLAPPATGDFFTPGRAEIVIPARTTAPFLIVGVPLLGGYFSVPAGTPLPPLSFGGPGTQVVNGTAQRLAPAGASNPFNPFNQDIGDTSRARLSEFGNRILRNETDAVMLTGGVRGENIAGRWNFDASYSYSMIRDKTRNSGVSASRFNEILNANSAIFKPGSSNYIGTTTPYNPFGYSRNPIPGNLALADYARVTIKDESESSLGQISLVASTVELFKLPHGAVGLAVGGDFRQEKLEQEPDAAGVAGDVVGDSPKAATNAQRKIGGVFVEARVPLMRGLEGTVAVRHEKFFSSGRKATVPKFALRATPFGSQLTLRGSYSKGFREPSLYELYSSPISALYPIVDPIDGFVEPEQPITLRGNRRLQAEKTDYLNTGFVWSPSHYRLKGFTLGVDRWEVTRKGTVEANPQQTVLRAFGFIPGGDLPGESVYVTNAGFISVVNSVFFNVGRTKVRGWDFSAGYQLPTDRLGRWELTTIWTLMDRFDRAAVAGASLRSVLGTDSTGTGEDGYLKWRGRTTLRWAYKGFTVHLAGNYNDGFADTDPNGNNFEVGDRFLVDAHVSYSFGAQRKMWLRDTKIAVGVHNLFDWDPPQAYGGGSNTNGYPGYLYTAENQFVYASVSRRF
jgi:iron complex outermembrane recepter protein